MKIFSGYVREQKRYTKNDLKHIFSFDEAGVEKFIKSLKAYGVLKSVKNSNAQLEMSDLVDEDIEITDETAVSGDCLYVFTYVGVISQCGNVRHLPQKLRCYALRQMSALHVIMTDQGRKTFLSAWQSKKQETIKHPYLDEKIEWGMAPYVQSMLLARYLRGDLDEYPPFFWK